MKVVWILILVLDGSGKAITTVPTPFQTVEECVKAGNDWLKQQYRYSYPNATCIKTREAST